LTVKHLFKVNGAWVDPNGVAATPEEIAAFETYAVEKEAQDLEQARLERGEKAVTSANTPEASALEAELATAKTALEEAKQRAADLEIKRANLETELATAKTALEETRKEPTAQPEPIPAVTLEELTAIKGVGEPTAKAVLALLDSKKTPA
jgi:predicted  nucleic acid-binding Zn-ribbon protein